MRGIYRYELSYGRCGTLTGIFIADSECVAADKATTIHFGEALGKHSEVTDTRGQGCYTLISDSPTDVDVFERLRLATGTNPVAVYHDQEGEYEDE